MRLSISNIAWDPHEDEAVAKLLSRHGVGAIDVAPGKYFSNPVGTSDREVAEVRRAWAGRGVAILGMQALLYGTRGLNLFADAAVQGRMLHHLEATCRIAAGLGASHLVFGSPKSRDRGGLADGEVRAAAVDFFGRLGEAAAAYGVAVCLEPNPPAYGSNFMLNSQETAAVVEAVGHPAIRLQLDVGALALNGEDAHQVLARWGRLVGHVHASEPGLVPLGEGGSDHRGAAAALAHHLPGQAVAIEMVAPAQGAARLAALDLALGRAVHWYLRDGGGACRP